MATTGKSVTLAQYARAQKWDPKAVRAKFRRAEKPPFDHTKVTALTAAQQKAVKAFMTTDLRVKH